MNRKPDWAKHLLAEIQAASERPFSWGEHDCALFACNVVNAMTGTDPAREFRGKYATKTGAARMIAGYGGLSQLAAWIAEEHGCEEINPAMAQRGDVLLVDIGVDGVALGVCAGGRAAVPALSGVWFVPMKQVVRAWATGR